MHLIKYLNNCIKITKRVTVYSNRIWHFKEDHKNHKNADFVAEQSNFFCCLSLWIPFCMLDPFE